MPPTRTPSSTQTFPLPVAPSPMTISLGAGSAFIHLSLLSITNTIKQNNMKQNILRSLLAVTFMATLLFSGCQKDSVTLRIRINDFGGNGKVYMDGYNPHWSSSEAFRINGEEHLVNGITGDNISLSVPSSPSYSAFYPSQFYSSSDGNAIHFTLPRVQYYEVDGSDNQLVKAPMAAFATTPSQTASNVPITFNNIGALLAINIDNNLLPNTATLTVDSVVVTTVGNTLPLWGNAVLPDITDPNSYYQCVNTPDHEKYYTVSVAKGNGNSLFTLNNGVSRKVYIFIPSAEALSTNKFKITVYAGANTKWQEQTSATGGLIRHGMMATVPFQMRNVEAPAGAVPGGQFTVGTNKRVWFSAGNLQWKPTANMSNPGTGTWRIAPNQWDFVGYDPVTTNYGTIAGSDNNRITDGTYTGWIDLFGWGTSGYDNPNDDYDIYHQPYDYIKESNRVNANNYYGYGPTGTSSTSFLSLEGDPYSNYDWGVYNTITYNGDAVSTATVKWRTLTSEEWGWLLGINTTNASNRRLSDGRRGIHVCFSPADYVTLDNKTIHGILVYDDDHLGSSLTDADNSTAKPVCCTLRQTQTGTGIPDGCVFLPATSYREYNNVNGYAVNTSNILRGYYWSTTVLSSKNANYAELTNNGNGGATITNTERYRGLSVRLVTPVQ